MQRMMINILSWFLLIFCFTHHLSAISVDETELELVQMMFRHGDRTPVVIYPTDPYDESTWDEYGGIGHLTQEGMRQLRQFGAYLREYYGSFLSQYHNPKEVVARSTDFDRTLMSTYSLLSGLYPPVGFQVFDESIDWQPIAVHTTDTANDMLFHPGPCPKTFKLREEVFKTDEYKKFTAEYQDLFDYITEKAGLANMMTFDDIWFIVDPLFVEKTHNLTLPDWAEKNYDKLLKMMNMGFYFDYRTLELARLSMGGILKDMRNNIINKVRNDTDQQIYLYGGHDTFIAALTKLLNVTSDIRQPPYASAIVVELRESIHIDDDYYVRVLMKNNTVKEPISLREMTIYGCEHLCPLKKFLYLTENRVINDFNTECGIVAGKRSGKNSLYSYL